MQKPQLSACRAHPRAL